MTTMDFSCIVPKKKNKDTTIKTFRQKMQTQYAVKDERETSPGCERKWSLGEVVRIQILEK
jgi:hypothetical protein